jgi:Tfp pilus assembly protein PilO
VKLGTRVWGLITFVVVVGVLAAGWFVGASPLLDEKARSDKAREAAHQQNVTIQATIDKLKDEKTRLADYEKREKELEAAIPTDIESAAFIQGLNDLATATGVTISRITLSDPTPYEAPAGEDSGSEFAPKPVTDPRVTGDNFLIVPVSLSVTGPWDNVLSFTHGIQTGQRLMLVTQVRTAGANTEGGDVSLDLSSAMYVLIRPSGPVAAPGTDSGSDAAAG